MAVWGWAKFCTVVWGLPQLLKMPMRLGGSSPRNPTPNNKPSKMPGEQRWERRGGVYDLSSWPRAHLPCWVFFIDRCSLIELLYGGIKSHKQNATNRFLQKSAVFCENLRLPNAIIPRKSENLQKSAKICEFGSLVCPFSFLLIF